MIELHLVYEINTNHYHHSHCIGDIFMVLLDILFTVKYSYTVSNILTGSYRISFG